MVNNGGQSLFVLCSWIIPSVASRLHVDVGVEFSVGVDDEAAPTTTQNKGRYHMIKGLLCGVSLGLLGSALLEVTFLYCMYESTTYANSISCFEFFQIGIGYSDSTTEVHLDTPAVRVLGMCFSCISLVPGHLMSTP